MGVSLKDLSKNEERLILVKTLRVSFDVICQCSALEVLHHKKNKMILEYNVKQFDYILMPRVQKLSQVAESCYFAAKQISGDFVVDGFEVDDFDGHAIEGVFSLKADINISRWAFTQEDGIFDAVGFVDGSYFPRLHWL